MFHVTVFLDGYLEYLYESRYAILSSFCFRDFIHTHYVKHRHAKRARVIFLFDRSIRRTVYSNVLVKFFGCDVQHERNCEFMMYIRCYIGNGKP